jgi:uncharacterized protein YabE (DUF348 family)/3D (Asp-Asp-Asp) domain-containing protein
MFTRKIRVLLILTLILGVLSGTASAFEGRASVYLYDDAAGVTRKLAARGDTVGDFLSQHRIEVSEFDAVYPGMDQKIANSMEIIITREVTVNAVIDDSGPIAVRTRKTDVEDFVAGFSSGTGLDYRYDASLTGAMLSDGMFIYLSTMKTAEFELVTDIPFETVYIQNPTIFRNRQVVDIEGSAGKQRTVIKVDYVAGVEASREVLSEVVLEQPVSRIIFVGTLVPGSEDDSEIRFITARNEEERRVREEEERKARAEDERLAREEADRLARIAADNRRRQQEEADRLAAVQRAAQQIVANEWEVQNEMARALIADGMYKEKRIMTTTAYSLDVRCTGKLPSHPAYGITASGMKAQMGVVAVDTRFIPFGTKLYIEGYGFGIAGDRGSGVNGWHVDVFKNSRSDALVYGKQQVMVYILD